MGPRVNQPMFQCPKVRRLPTGAPRTPASTWHISPAVRAGTADQLPLRSRHQYARTVGRQVFVTATMKPVTRHVLSRLHTVSGVAVPLVEIPAIVVREFTVHACVFHH
jgi:hypothetical protein